MPVRPENRSRYPKDWRQISQSIRDRAGNRCEGSPAFPDCRAENGAPHPETGSVVVLTVAHLDHMPENCAPENLRAWCQRCHNVYDAPARRAGAKARAKAKAAEADLFACGEEQNRPGTV
jgi:5-methylcytosine-specific restriction endonuclease McrA